ncbi:MAG TPA: DUF4399 domain-containing protein [Leptospiraceae bacterium]|nr:DUF4399 domain-containing protein [Leptospiraceae bacterium]HMW06889.1 DUF4399 domain-containing protein [Leptospiraceae bacterium]HMX34069.1 DUF4399 domain-containing protein [Leptospiraceae bacterium]HMY32408.1 DUF4399 domain-containing protein [Leptospiraceae bacterium]HMZ65296.1 DUF4399 domain-containing protein [Leptospiraceae bacterium]
MFKYISILLIVFSLVACTKKPTGKVFFLTPQNGEEVKSPVVFKMGVEGMEVAPAGEVQLGKGHHHIIINGESYDSGKTIPFVEKKVFHFGKGQTEASIELEPGEYDVTLQFANGAHISYGPELSSKIRIKVVP